MWGNPRPGHTRCASDGCPACSPPDTAVTRENTGPQESYDTPPRRAANARTGSPGSSTRPHGGIEPTGAVIAPATVVAEANRAHRRALGPTDGRRPGPS